MWAEERDGPSYYYTGYRSGISTGDQCVDALGSRRQYGLDQFLVLCRKDRHRRSARHFDAYGKSLLTPIPLLCFV